MLDNEVAEVREIKYKHSNKIDCTMFLNDTFNWLVKNGDSTQKLGYYLGFFVTLNTFGAIIPKYRELLYATFIGYKENPGLTVEMGEDKLIHIKPDKETRYEIQFIFVMGASTPPRLYTKETLSKTNFFPLYKDKPFKLSLSNFKSYLSDNKIPSNKKDKLRDYFSIIICYNALGSFNYSILERNYFSENPIPKTFDQKVEIDNHKTILETPVKYKFYNRLENLFLNRGILNFPFGKINKAKKLIQKEYGFELIKRSELLTD